jgi:hypothetical protein
MDFINCVLSTVVNLSNVNIQFNLDKNILSQDGVKVLKLGADLFATFTVRLSKQAARNENEACVES